MKPGRFHRLIDAFSQLLNVLLYNGEPNHSLSGDAYRFGRTRLLKTLDWIFERLPFGLAETEHCRKSHEADVNRGCDLCKETKG